MIFQNKNLKILLLKVIFHKFKVKDSKDKVLFHKALDCRLEVNLVNQIITQTVILMMNFKIINQNLIRAVAISMNLSFHYHSQPMMMIMNLFTAKVNL